jgi:hypothetical protein
VSDQNFDGEEGSEDFLNQEQQADDFASFDPMRYIRQRGGQQPVVSDDMDQMQFDRRRQAAASDQDDDLLDEGGGLPAYTPRRVGRTRLTAARMRSRFVSSANDEDMTTRDVLREVGTVARPGLYLFGCALFGAAMCIWGAAIWLILGLINR